MKNLQKEIISAEETYLDRLESFFNSKYPHDRLISHGMEHHRRVWGYAKELLRCMGAGDTIVDRTFIQKLIIACYLHDIGMAEEAGEKHGRLSSEFCMEFLKENNINVSDNIDILSAIENHDDKQYTDPGKKDQLLTVLSVADDLDAFGDEGIVRYIEIYRKRGIKDRDISKAVRENAKKRFENFERTFGEYPDLVKKHKGRYKKLISYFENNEQMQ